ncbi:MAG: hypothetical protein DRQ88_03035 [Epsilonproteobacteria bacterium]|nr:MAG: hypothetical protein DRQ89_01990 [Campylobacterota bacterium]RLA67447.1 MAG: hypothetical protein DRQ88_03035 [Campylobacterota bacterium]
MDTAKKNIFINGKNKAFEIIQMLNSDERTNILQKIQVKNPKLAEELMHNSYSFKDIARLEDTEIQSIFPKVAPPVFGMALRDLDTTFQRRVLSLAPRKYAESAYQTLMGQLKDDAIHIKRAQNKISEIVINLIRNKSI